MRLPVDILFKFIPALTVGQFWDSGSPLSSRHN
eukprot:COSAG02_NODE_66332_length_255_cov_1.333333_1_plen_32_part_01